MTSGSLSRIAVYPIKSLDPLERDRVSVVDGGGLEFDRSYAIFDRDGEYVNGKRTAKVHRVRSTFDPDGPAVTLSDQDSRSASTSASDDGRRFGLESDQEALDAWLSEYFEQPVTVRRTTGGGFTDSSAGAGPTLISTATLREVASWFPDLSVEQMRLRFRPNLEIDGVPPFWEDRLVAAADDIAFRIGDVRLVGVKPVPRCVVPTRDPVSGETYEGFQETFVKQRKKTFPSWADSDAFDHLFKLMIVTRISDSERGKTLRVGDSVEILEDRSVESSI